MAPTPLTEEHKAELSPPKEKPLNDKNPTFAALRSHRGTPSNLEPEISFNSKRYPFKRCTTHAAIAYYIFFHQRAIQDKLHSNLDPTYEARILKGKTEKTRSSMVQNFSRYYYGGSSYPFYQPERNNWNMMHNYNYNVPNTPREPYLQSNPNLINPVGIINTNPKEPSLTLPPVKNSLNTQRVKLDTLLDNPDYDRNVNLFPKIIINPEDTKLSTMVNPNLLTTHEIKTTHFNSHQSQIPIEHRPYPPYEDFPPIKLENNDQLKVPPTTNLITTNNKLPSPNSTPLIRNEKISSENGDVVKSTNQPTEIALESIQNPTEAAVPLVTLKQEIQEQTNCTAVATGSTPLNETMQPESDKGQL